MSVEETIQAELTGAFAGLREHVRIARPRRVWVDAPRDQVYAVLEHAAVKLDCGILCTITGLDLGDQMQAIYHLARPDGVVISVATKVPKAAPVLETISGRYPPADAYERELMDLLGFQVQGLPKGSRYPLPDGWPEGQHPLRKDWKPDSLPPTMRMEGGKDA